MSVDTYLQGKKIDGYRRFHDDDLLVLVSPKLVQWANKVELSTKKKIIGSKLIVAAQHEHTARCRH